METSRWFKLKGYTHFSPKITWPDYHSYVQYYVTNPQKIKTHAFYPLIHRRLIQRRYKIPKGCTKKENSKRTEKTRKIFFANHLDNHIYSYYSDRLNGIYKNRILSFNIDLNNCIIAYRRLEKENQAGKSNIDFAYEVFDFIKKQPNAVTALTFDIESFFDCLNHKHLYKCWCNLLSVDRLPEDHYNIYKSLINFSYVNEHELIHEFDLKHRNELRRKKVDCYCQSNTDFSQRVRGSNNKFKKTLIRKHPFVDKSSGIKCGIPQGTPISAFLSNLYLFEFDKVIFQKIVTENKGLYRRYSDDLIVVCDSDKAEEIKDFILSQIKIDYHLTIQASKTETICFESDNEKKKVTGNKLLCYLGFNFDGNNIYIKPASLAKYYRKFRSAIKTRAFKAYRVQRQRKSIHYSLYRSRIYRYYSHLGKRNFISYASRASNIMQSKSIKRQISKHWINLHKTIKSKEEKYNLLRR